MVYLTGWGAAFEVTCRNQIQQKSAASFLAALAIDSVSQIGMV
jgi:hypothetical protein